MQANSAHDASPAPAIVQLYDAFQALGYGSVANRAFSSTAWSEPTTRTRQIIFAGNPPGKSMLTDDAVQLLLGLVSVLPAACVQPTVLTLPLSECPQRGWQVSRWAAMVIDCIPDLV